MTDQIKVIDVPDDDKPISALDGYTLMAIDTDPEENIERIKANAPLNGLEIVSVSKVQFHGTRPGFLVVLYDRSQDSSRPA